MLCWRSQSTKDEKQVLRHIQRGKRFKGGKKGAGGWALGMVSGGVQDLVRGGQWAQGLFDVCFLGHRANGRVRKGGYFAATKAGPAELALSTTY